MGIRFDRISEGAPLIHNGTTAQRGRRKCSPTPSHALNVTLGVLMVTGRDPPLCLVSGDDGRQGKGMWGFAIQWTQSL